MLIVHRPQIVEEPLTETRWKFAIEPLEPGFGYTLGNSLRRTLLSSIPGAAITTVRFDDALHEFDTIALGSLSCRRLTVVGATGALPSEQIRRLDRSASSKRGEAINNSAIAGTMKVARGRRASTTSNHASTSKRGM